MEAEYVDIAELSAPVSEDLGAADLLAGPITVTIVKVTKASREGKPFAKIYTDCTKPWWCPKTQQRMLAKRWGWNGALWAGRRMTLWCDPGAEYGGVAVGGPRVTHMSGIKESFTEALNEKRKALKGKPLIVTIHPLPDTAPDPLAEVLGDIPEPACMAYVTAQGWSAPTTPALRAELAGYLRTPDGAGHLAAMRGSQ